MSETVSERCHRTQVQDCHICEAVSCGDNMNPYALKAGLTRLRRELEDAHKAVVFHGDRADTAERTLRGVRGFVGKLPLTDEVFNQFTHIALAVPAEHPAAATLRAVKEWVFQFIDEELVDENCGVYVDPKDAQSLGDILSTAPAACEGCEKKGRKLASLKKWTESVVMGDPDRPWGHDVGPQEWAMLVSILEADVVLPPNPCSPCAALEASIASKDATMAQIKRIHGAMLLTGIFGVPEGAKPMEELIADIGGLLAASPAPLAVVDTELGGGFTGKKFKTCVIVDLPDGVGEMNQPVTVVIMSRTQEPDHATHQNDND